MEVRSIGSERKFNSYLRAIWFFLVELLQTTPYFSGLDSNDGIISSCIIRRPIEQCCPNGAFL